MLFVTCQICLNVLFTYSQKRFFLRIKLNVVEHNFRNFNLFIILTPTSNEQFVSSLA